MLKRQGWLLETAVELFAKAHSYIIKAAKVLLFLPTHRESGGDNLEKICDEKARNFATLGVTYLYCAYGFIWNPRSTSWGRSMCIYVHEPMNPWPLTLNN